MLANCWAHVYRRFEGAKPDHPEAAKALAWIGAFYEIDRRAEGELKRLGCAAPNPCACSTSSRSGCRR